MARKAAKITSITSDGMANIKNIPTDGRLDAAQYHGLIQQEELPRAINRSDGYSDPVIPEQIAPGQFKYVQNPELETAYQAPPQSQSDRLLAEAITGSQNPKIRQAPTGKPAEISEDESYDGSSLMQKLAEMQGQAMASGRKVEMGGTAKTNFYLNRFKTILGLMASNTNMTVQEGKDGIQAFWYNEKGYFGLNRIYTNDPTGLILSLADREDINTEDASYKIEFKEDMAEFDGLVETFLCNLYAKFLQ